MNNPFLKTEIKKEDFWKLHQLDRIEFRQRLQNIKDEHVYVGVYSWINTILGLSLFCFLLSVVSFGYNQQLASTFMSLIPEIITVGVWIAIFLLIVQQVLNYKTNKAKKKLVSEYFSTDLKVYSPEKKITKVKEEIKSKGKKK
jgi:hypothetical protein